MPRYVVSSESPISVRAAGRPGQPLPPGVDPTDPDYGIEGPVHPDTGLPIYPGQGLPPQLPPREEWPPLPPWLQPGVGLPIPPSVEHPMVPIPEAPEVGLPIPPDIWPPPRPPIELPDLSSKSLALVRVYVSRHVNYLAWMVIDHEDAKAKIKAALDAIKDRLPAGGAGGRPPSRPGT